MKKLLTVLFISIIFIPVPGYALRVSGLYEAEVPVPDQSETNRQQGVRTALQMVLVKLTGDRFTAGKIAISPIINTAGDYVQQYRYTEFEKIPTEQGLPPARELLLWVRFDEPTLNKALRDLSVPVWGRERPSILIWLVIQDASGRNLVNMEDNPDIIRVLDKRARARGAALIYPLLDLEDTSRLRASDIWGDFREPILAASRRYQADTVLTGSIESSTPGIWEGRWTAYIDGDPASWISEGDLRDVVLDEGIDGMVDSLATRFARASVFAEKTSVDITVADIFNADQYAKTLKYLESLIAVSDLQVTRVEPGKVSFKLVAHGGELAVQQAIALGRILEPIGEDHKNAFRLLP